MSNNKQVWTVGIIMMHDGISFFEYNELEQSILDQKKFEYVRYVIFYYDQESKLATIKKLERDSDGVFRFVKKEGPTLKDLYNKSDLIDFLKKYVRKDTSEADNRIMIITWGHAAGLGYFAQREEDSSGVDYFKDYSLIDLGLTPENKVKFNKLFNFFTFFKANSSSKFSTDGLMSFVISENLKLDRSPMFEQLIRERLKVITARDLNEIFELGLPEQKVDILLTINCYTQMFEMGYAFRSKVKMLVSPQTTIPFAGINYRTLFEVMEGSPSTDLTTLAENIRDNFHKKYSEEPFKTNFFNRYPNFVKKIKEVSISANFPEYYESFYDTIEKIASPFLRYSDRSSGSYSPVIKQVILNSRRACGDLTVNRDYGIIDFNHFLNEFDVRQKGYTGIDWNTIYSDFLNAKGKCNAATLKSIDPNAYTPFGTYETSISPLFLSIFFPFGFTSEIQRLLVKMYDGFEPDPLRTFTWDDFVLFLFKDS